MMGLLCVGAGGALGAMGRYGLGLIPLGSELPLMTLLINFLGSVAIGAIVETSELAGFDQVLVPFVSQFNHVCRDIFVFEGYALVSVVLCVAGVLVGKVLARALMPTG